MNILFTCAGRRNYLINYFKEIIGDDGKIISVDNQLTAPALVDSDIAIKVPKIYSPDYIPSILSIIKEHKIDAIISLNDLELPILSKNRTIIENLEAQLIVSNERVINISFDKWKTFLFFKELNINTPKTYKTIESVLEAINVSKLDYPLILKPRWGSASIAIETANNEEELRLIHKLQKIKIKNSILNKASLEDIDCSILIQEKIIGEEYGIDILNDFNGNYYGSFVRKKLAMRSGETDKAVSVIEKRFSNLGRIIGKNTKHLGNMDCDFFVANDDIYFLEMNPRFGGGYPFSHEAGINTVAIYIEWLKGNTNVGKHNNFKEGLTFSKCDRIIAIQDNN